MILLTPTVSQRHLAIVLSTLLKCADVSPVRLLDMGCGDAHLLAYLAQILPSCYPDRRFEFYGFEVGDIGWHGEGYAKSAAEFLDAHAPGNQWSDRVAVFSASQPWPYQSASFDVIVSNQVLEHVRDHAFLFGEIERCLAPQGVSIHLFPLRETIYEVHAHMPIVHWIRDSKRRAQLMFLFAKLGMRSKYKDELDFRGWKNLREFAAVYSNVLETMTNYKSSKQITELAEGAGLQADFTFTKDFFSTKLFSMMKRTRNLYSSRTWFDDAIFPLLKRAASATLILRKRPPAAAAYRY